jgi:DNA repair exonuclease SbcCD ATPase subunit
MHITELRAENVTRLTAVSVKPDGSLVVVGGRNGQGKTSLLDSIAMALGGKDLMSSEPLRRGEKKGEVEIKLNDGTVIRRTFTPGGGGALIVSNKDGARYGSPQKMLDGLVGKLSFDPLAFSRMDTKAQAQTLRDLVGIDFAALDGQRKALYDQRTDVAREVKRIDGVLATMQAVSSDAPTEGATIAELAAELETRRAQNATLRDATQKLEELRMRAVVLKQEITDGEDNLFALREQLDNITASGKNQAAKVANLPPADEAEVVERIKNIEAFNAAARAALDRRCLAAESESLRDKVDEMTAAINIIDETKREKLAETKMPIEGLAFNDEGVTLAGLPLAQASSAEQLRASVAIGLAMHPKLRVLLVRDGSLLDEQSLVGKGAECSVIIEDGHVAAESKPERAQASLPMREPGAEG